MIDDRRDFLHKLLWGSAGALLTPNLAFGEEKPAPKPPKKGLTIAGILTVAYPAVLADFRKGNKWIDPELNRRQEEGLILRRFLGHTVEVPVHLGNGNFSSNQYPVQEISVPLVWNDRDEAEANTANKKISLVSQLLKNGLYAHDDLLLENMGKHLMVVSKEYVYGLSKVYRLEAENAFVVKIYTAAAFIPRKEHLWQKNEQSYSMAGQVQARRPN
jgi:hypothetical protein